MDTSELVSGWIALTERGPKGLKDDDPKWRCHEEINELIRNSPDEGWQIILSIMNATSDDSILGNLAAGPLEDLLTWHGELIIDRVETFSRQNPKFRALLRGVWQNAMPENLWKRVTKAAN